MPPVGGAGTNIMTADTGQQPSLPAGTILKHGDYRIDRLLGSGGFGNTYLAFDNNMQVACAIKEFFLDGYNVRQSNGTVTIGTGTRRDIVDKQREKFRTEALRLFRLKHTNIVGVHGFFEENGTAYYVMDFVKGQSLASLLKNNQGPFSETKVMQEIMPQLLDALEYIHSQPEMVLHMDLKPENIMLRADGNVCLIDFGASKAFDFYSEDRPSTISSYTPLFAPPEQIDNLTEHIGPWTDFYALGGTLYELLTCKKPPRVSDVINRKDAAFDYSQVPQLSAKVRQLIRWMMQPERERRPQSVAEIRNALSGESVEQGVEQSTSVASNENKTKVDVADALPASKLHWLRKAALILVPAVVIVLGLFITRDYGVEQPEAESPDEQMVEVANGNLTFHVRGVSFTMVAVEGGTFTMGATSGVRYCDNRPAHKVTLDGYCIGETEVTQALWKAVMGSNPSNFYGDDLPVDGVSWEDCMDFIARLNSITGYSFCLPTEAEWEYAARGGNKSRGYEYSGSNNIGEVAWYGINSRDTTHPVKGKAPNELGLYDMSGNVYEWCQNWFDGYSSTSQINPTGPDYGTTRVIRGGSWRSNEAYVRVAYRSYCMPSNSSKTIGFRLAL